MHPGHDFCQPHAEAASAKTVRHGFLVVRTANTPNGICRIGIAGSTAITEFRYVHPAVSSLAVENPRLRTLERLANLPLCEASLLPHFPKECGDVTLTPFVWGLGQHKRLIFYPEFA
jgi:hypothetical protein